MATVRTMTNVAIAMQSALAAAVTITGITKATEGVVACSTPPADGSYIVLTVQGMQQLDGKVYRTVGQVASTSFKLQDVTGTTGINTLAFDAFSSGSFQVITFGTSLTTVAEITMSGGDFSKVDSTVIHGNVKRERPGVASAVSIDIKHNWDITDAGQLAMRAASDSQTPLAMKVTFGTGGNIMVFSGYVGYVGLPTGGFGDVIKSAANISANSAPTYYSA
jgi:hypothetical protein